MSARNRLIDHLKDFWFLLGRILPFPTRAGLRRVGNPDRSSPVLVTANFELTVRRVVQTLERDRIDAWLLVAPTKGINVWCASGAGHFTADTVISIIKTSGIDDLVDHRRLILPQLCATGVNLWAVRERTDWKPRFGPAHIKDLAAYLRSDEPIASPEHRRVEFPVADRLTMGTNSGFTGCLILLVPLLIVSVWMPGLWWKTLLLHFALSVLCSVLVFRLPGKIGVQKGLSLGVLVAAVFLTVAQVAGTSDPGQRVGWVVWILFLSALVGFDEVGWSPLWRQNIKELVFGTNRTNLEIDPDKCIYCHLCDIVCPAGVFIQDAEPRKYRVARLDACLACGACIENCPTDAITNNFRKGACSCPTCLVLDRVGQMSGNKPAAESTSPASKPEVTATCSADDPPVCQCDGTPPQNTN